MEKLTRDILGQTLNATVDAKKKLQTKYLRSPILVINNKSVFK
jgi:hypothetical protein